MDLSQFTSPELGTLVQITGHNSRRDEYYEHHAFVPQDLPRAIRLSNKTHTLVSTASVAIGQLQQCLKRLPKPEILLRPSLAREAKSTSALEGTYAPLQDILEGDFVEETNISAAVKEIRNYIRAAYRGLDLIKTKPICISVLSELQGITVEGTTGARINQGETRTGQVIIGDDSKPVEKARFNPPPAIDMLKGYNEWENGLMKLMILGEISRPPLNSFYLKDHCHAIGKTVRD